MSARVGLETRHFCVHEWYLARQLRLGGGGGEVRPLLQLLEITTVEREGMQKLGFSHKFPNPEP